MYKKILVIFGLLSSQLIIGGLFAWSVLSTALISKHGWSQNSMVFTYSLAQWFFAFSTIFSGKIIDKHGPRITLLIGSVFFGGGLVLSSFVTVPFLLYITFGVISGIGVGFVYVTPLSTLIKWFPNHKGTVTGLSISVFGGGSIVIKQLLHSIITSHDVSTAFMVLGILSFFVIFIGSFLVKLPDEYNKNNLDKVVCDLTSKEMMRQKNFYLIIAMFWLAVIPGLLVLGTAKAIGLDAGLSEVNATNLITIIALANTISRLVVGNISERLGIVYLLKVTFVLTIFSLIIISTLSDINFFLYLSLIGIGVGYGSFLTLFPTLTNKQFGQYHYAENYGIIFQAYGLASLTGSLIFLFGSFQLSFIVSAIAGVIGLFIVFNVKNLDDSPCV